MQRDSAKCTPSTVSATRSSPYSSRDSIWLRTVLVTGTNFRDAADLLVARIFGHPFTDRQRRVERPPSTFFIAISPMIPAAANSSYEANGSTRSLRLILFAVGSSAPAGR